MTLRTGPPPGMREEDMVLRPWAKALLAVCVLFLAFYCLFEWTVVPLVVLGVVFVAMAVRSSR